MKKGFTLIELLAVIVILAIISLIATPLILNVVEDTKKKSAEVSAYGYVDAVEKQVMINQLDTDGSNDIKDGSYSITKLRNKNVTVKGTEPTGELKIEKGKVVSYKLKINGYTVELKDSKVTVTKGETEDIKYTVYSNGTAIYYNPVTNELCNSNESVSTTGTKEGCMKWYIFNDTEDSATVNMILDHNTTELVAWNSSKNNTDGMNEAAISLSNDTKDWNSKLNARLITANEIAKITGNTDFNVSTSQSAFCLDTNMPDNEMACFKSQGSSSYIWLFDYTKMCTNYGCNKAESNSYGYWTSDSVYSDTINAWVVGSNGSLSWCNIDNTNAHGIRPVVTLEKTIIQ